MKAMATKKPQPAYISEPAQDLNWDAAEAYLNQPLPTAPDESAGVLRTAGDMGIKAAQGIVGIGQSAVGLASLATGGLAGEGLRAIGYDPEATNAALGTYLSDPQKKADAEVAKAEGFVDTVMAALKNPRAIAGSVAESAPGTLMGMGISLSAARAIGTKAALAAAAEHGGLETVAGKAAAAEATKAALEKATGKLMWIGSGAEGAQSAGQIADQAQGEGRSWSQYAAPAILAGTGTAAIGRGAGKLMGDSETAIIAHAAGGPTSAGIKGSLPARVAKSMFSEGALEELPQSAQEQAFTNIATGKPVGEGVANAAAMGFVTGAAMGGGTALVQGKTPQEQAAETLRASKLPESGPLSRAANAGIEAQALEFEKVSIPPVPESGLSLAPADGNTIDYTPATPPAPSTAGMDNLAAYGSSKLHAVDLAALQDQVAQLNTEGQHYTIIPHTAGGYAIAPTDKLTPGILEAVAKLQPDPNAAQEATPDAAQAGTPEQKPAGSFGTINEFGNFVESEKSDLKTRRAQAAQAQADYLAQEAMRLDAEIAAVDASVEQRDKARSANERMKIVDAVLSDDGVVGTENKKAKISADLKRAGYSSAKLTDAEATHVERHAELAQTFTEPDTLPSAPNEMPAYLVPEKKSPVKTAAPNNGFVALPEALQAAADRAKTPTEFSKAMNQAKIRISDRKPFMDAFKAQLKARDKTAANMAERQVKEAKNDQIQPTNDRAAGAEVAAQVQGSESPGSESPEKPNVQNEHRSDTGKPATSSGEVTLPANRVAEQGTALNGITNGNAEPKPAPAENAPAPKHEPTSSHDAKEAPYRITRQSDGKFTLENDDRIEAGNGDGRPRKFPTAEAAAEWARKNGYEVEQNEPQTAPEKEKTNAQSTPETAPAVRADHTAATGAERVVADVGKDPAEAAEPIAKLKRKKQADDAQASLGLE